jgi:hypothetical protein
MKRPSQCPDVILQTTSSSQYVVERSQAFGNFLSFTTIFIDAIGDLFVAPDSWNLRGLDLSLHLFPLIATTPPLRNSALGFTPLGGAPLSSERIQKLSGWTKYEGFTIRKAEVEPTQSEMVASFELQAHKIRNFFHTSNSCNVFPKRTTHKLLWQPSGQITCESIYRLRSNLDNPLVWTPVFQSIWFWHMGCFY